MRRIVLGFLSLFMVCSLSGCVDDFKENLELSESYELVTMEYTVSSSESAKASGFLFFSYSSGEETTEEYRYMYKRADGGIIKGTIDYTEFYNPENVTVLIYEDDSQEPKLEIWRNFDLESVTEDGDPYSRTEYRFTIPTGSIVNYYNPQGLDQDQNQKEKSE